MNPKPYRVTYLSLDDSWCRYFKTYRKAAIFLSKKQASGYHTYLTYVQDH